MSIIERLALIAVIAAILLPGAGPVQFARPAVAQSAVVTAARLNPNTATEEQLRGIPQLNAELISLIQQNRPFRTMGDFNKQLAGRLGAEQLRQLYTVLFVPINLNTASRDDVMLIPGMTARMAHEFEEYRPYRNIEQFNREIGKYVNLAEVARLRSYVSLN